MYSGATALALVVLLASFDSGLCLNCYQCTSTNNENCKDPFKNSDTITTVTCDSNNVGSFYRSFLQNILQPPQTANAPKYCLKMILGTSLGETVLRTCVEGASDNMNKTCSELARPNQNVLATAVQSTLKHCSVCNGDKCNGVAATAASLSLAAGAAVLAYLARY